MKVCLELQPYLKTKSGIGVYAYEITKHLRQFEQLDAYVQVFNLMNKEDMDIELNGLEFKKDISTTMSYAIYRRIWHYIPIKYNTLFKEQGDIYHFFDYIVPPRIKGKVITTIHDMTYELYPETMQKTTRDRIKKDIYYSIERADEIITISESTKKDMKDILNIPEDKIEIVPPGVDFHKFHREYEEPQIKQVRQKYNLPDEYILYMGTLEPRKNIETIIEAFAMLKRESDYVVDKVKLVIAGKKGWLYETIFNKVNELGLEKQVVFTDYVSEVDKPIIYQLAKIFIFPSIYEGFGIPVIEAMAASVPVITSNVSSLPEVAGDAAILIHPTDIVKMAEGMHTVLTNEMLSQEMVEKGWIQAQKFNWSSSAKQLYDIYQKLLASR